VVDTEEEFDWNAPFDRGAVDVSAAAEIWRLQEIVEPYGVKPTYVVDYPIATTALSADVLRDLAARGVCEVGAHLHPWVTPPHQEAVSGHLSFASNLDPVLERAKLTTLKQAIVDGVGVVPVVYKAGRYGLGIQSLASLESLGFDVDVSVNPHMDFRAIGGPSFLQFSEAPARLPTTRPMIEVPCTTGFIGWGRRRGESLHDLASRRPLARLRAVGVLARTGVLNRVMLSPEGNSLSDMIALTRALYNGGLRTFSLTFHSPSLKPGCTPYVRTVGQRDALLATILEFLSFFTDELGGRPVTPREVFMQFIKGPVS
jgi:hypothetical protein